MKKGIYNHWKGKKIYNRDKVITMSLNCRWRTSSTKIKTNRTFQAKTAPRPGFINKA